MPRPCPPLHLAVVLAGLSLAGPPLARAELPDHLALALPISGITVDGDLSDWPPEMPSLPIRNEFGAYGPTDTEATNLDTSQDLSPSFRVGYDPEEQLLYVAVEVRDDILYSDWMVSQTDACEIYVSGLVSSDHTPIQYALVPGRVTYTSFDRRGVHRNLRVDRRSRGAWLRRDGRITTYEWGVQVRSGLPADPRTDPRHGYTAMNPDPGRVVRLEGGGMIGFDVVVVDGDGPPRGSVVSPTPTACCEETASWVPWGPPRSIKMVGDDRVGRLVLAPEDWSAGFDAEAMEAYLETWLREHPDVWIAAIERAAARQSRPHSHPLARRLEQAAGAISRADARMLGTDAPGPATWDHRTVPWGSPGGPMGADAGPPGEDELLQALRRELRGDSGRDDWLVLLGGCLLGLAVGLGAVYVVRRRTQPDPPGLTDRLAALESRMTDTQDVMIALSEKLDRIDSRHREGTDPPPASGS